MFLFQTASKEKMFTFFSFNSKKPVRKLASSPQPDSDYGHPLRAEAEEVNLVEKIPAHERPLKMKRFRESSHIL
jgi:hypothetical protein